MAVSLPQTAKLKLQPDISDTYCIWDGLYSEDSHYRYVLYRDWNQKEVLPHLVVIGLNPSVADEQHDDRTVRKCISFARREKFGSLTVLNIFAFRTTKSNELLKCSDPIGRDNDYHILQECENATKVVVAWGTNGKIFDRSQKVLNLLKKIRLFCFGVNRDGTPKHPLYLSLQSKLVEMEKT